MNFVLFMMMHAFSSIWYVNTQTKIPIIYIDSLDGCILYMIFDNQMEKIIFMIGLFPSCVCTWNIQYYLYELLTTSYVHYYMYVYVPAKRSLLHILSALDCQKTRIKAASDQEASMWPAQNTKQSLKNRWHICINVVVRNIQTVVGDIQIHLGLNAILQIRNPSTMYVLLSLAPHICIYSRSEKYSWSRDNHLINTKYLVPQQYQI